MRERSQPPPPLLAAAAQVPLPPSPKPFSRFFNSSNRSRTPQDIPLPPSPMRPSSALSTSSLSHSLHTSVDSVSTEEASRWSPYSTPRAPKSNPLAAFRRSLNLSSASSASGSSSTRRSSSILTSSGGGITAKEIVQPSPRLRLHVDTESSSQAPLSPSHFNFLQRGDPPSSPSPFTSALDLSPIAPSPPPIRRARKSFWPSRVSSGNRHAEQGGAPNKLGEKLSQFVGEAKRKLGGSRRGRRKFGEATRSARELEERDDRLLKQALWTLFDESSSAIEMGKKSTKGYNRDKESDQQVHDTSSPLTSPRRLHRRLHSPSSPSHAHHTTPAPPPRRNRTRTRTPKLPRVSFGDPFEVAHPFPTLDEEVENDTSGEETPRVSRMVRKVVSVEELAREREGDETPTRHRTPRHSVSMSALRTSSTPPSKPKISSLLVLEDAPVLPHHTSESLDQPETSTRTTSSSTSPTNQHRDGEKNAERDEAHQAPTRSLGDLTNTLSHSIGPSSTSHVKSPSLHNSYTRSQVRCPSPLAQSYTPTDEDDLLSPLHLPQRVPILATVRFSFASEDGGCVEEQKRQWVDESEEGSAEDHEENPRHSIESSGTFGNGLELSDSSATDQEPFAVAFLSSSAQLSSLPLTRPPSHPPPPVPRAARISSEWMSYAHADAEEEDDLGDHFFSASTPTSFARALEIPLPRSSSTEMDDLLASDDSPTSPPLPPLNQTSEDRRRSHPLPFTSLRSLSSLASTSPLQDTPHATPSSPASTPTSTPTHPPAPNSTPTAAAAGWARYTNATTHPLLRGTFLLSGRSEAGQREKEGEARE